jgi:hypothetical protein
MKTIIVLILMFFTCVYAKIINCKNGIPLPADDPLYADKKFIKMDAFLKNSKELKLSHNCQGEHIIVQ